MSLAAFEVGRVYRDIHGPVSVWRITKRTAKYVTLQDERDGLKVCKKVRRAYESGGLVEAVWPKGNTCSPVMASLEVEDVA